MKFLRTLKCDLNKSVVNIGFVGAAVMSCILCFTSSVYYDAFIDKSYSVFEAFFTLEKELIDTDDRFASIFVFMGGLSGYISMFMPIVVAFPFMVSFCAERNNGLIRFTITRAGKYRYYFSKFFAAMISGGLAVTLGVMLYGIVVFAAFPPLSNYTIAAEDLMYRLPHGVLKSIVLRLISSFIYGAISCLPAFFISSFCKNPYIITCLPFMLIYVWNTALSKITANALANMDYELFDKIEPFYPDAIKSIPFYDFSQLSEIQKNTIIFNVGYLLVLLVGFVIVMNLRTDKGS